MTLAGLFDDLTLDLRFAARQIRSRPSFAGFAVLTLALGIGATTTLFTVLKAVVLQPLPFPAPERLIDVATEWQRSPGAVSVGNYFVIKETARTLESVAARSGATFNLSGVGDPERIQGARVTASYFDVFGVRPLLGRVFSEAEDERGEAPIAILAHGLFVRRFGADPHLVGRTVLLSGTPHLVLGVMPPDFGLPEDTTEIWTPIAFGPERSFDAHYLTVTARLKAGVSKEQLRSDVLAISAAVRKAAPRDNEGRTFLATGLLARIVGDYRTRLLILLGAVTLVFLIACLNVASLLLARGTAREGEIRLRAALGASRARIARQLLAETLVLSSLGAIVGLILALVALPVFVSQSPSDVPRLSEARIDMEALLLASFAAFVATLLAGLAPALRASRAGLASGAAAGSRGSTEPCSDRLRHTLVAVEVGFALMLLMGAGLMVRSGLELDRVKTGFDPENLLSARLALPTAAYPGEVAPAAAVERIVSSLENSAGVSEAAASTRPPLIGDVTYGLRIEGRDPTPANRINGRMQLVTPGYIETMRVPLREGRTLTTSDRFGATRVMVISETLARTAWPNESPIGKRIACCEGTDSEPVFKEVVGVVADTKARGVASPSLSEFYMTLDQAPRRAFEANGGSITLIARAANGQPETLTTALRQSVRSVDAAIPLYDVATMSSRVAASTAVTRFNRLLLSCLGGVGLMLAAIGIYGVVAYLMSQRTREIGVRMALGARPADVLGLVVRQGLGAVTSGVVLGSLGVVAQGRALESVLFGVSGRDPLTLGAAALVLIVFAVAASALPSRRAVRIDPTKALAEP
jgi:putative ABC transport system permease protein